MKKAPSPLVSLLPIVVLVILLFATIRDCQFVVFPRDFVESHADKDTNGGGSKQRYLTSAIEGITAKYTNGGE